MEKKLKLKDSNLEKVSGGTIAAKSSRELEEEREALIANKVAYTIVGDVVSGNVVGDASPTAADIISELKS